MAVPTTKATFKEYCLRALVSDGNGDVSVSAVTSTEIGHLDGVTSAIQTQLDTKTTPAFAIAMAMVLG